MFYSVAVAVGQQPPLLQCNTQTHAVEMRPTLPHSGAQCPAQMINLGGEIFQSLSGWTVLILVSSAGVCGCNGSAGTAAPNGMHTMRHGSVRSSRGAANHFIGTPPSPRGDFQ